MLLVLIGPSRVGKSTLGRYATDVLPRCLFYDLDALIAEETSERVSVLLPRIGNQAFLVHCRQALATLEQTVAASSSLCLVAVGTGCLQATDEATGWLGEHATIAITAPPAEVSTRDHVKGRDLVSTEYSAARQALYQRATYQFSVAGLAQDAARQSFVTWLTAPDSPVNLFRAK